MTPNLRPIAGSAPAVIPTPLPLILATAHAALAIHGGHIGRLVDNRLNAAQGQSQIFRIVRGQRHVDVDQQHDQEGRQGKRPPAIGVVVDAEGVQERRGQVGPEEVHEEGERGEEVEDEAVVLVGWDLGGGAGDGLQLVGGGVGGCGARGS